MANSSDWIGHVSYREPSKAMPGWIAALGASGSGETGVFSEASPFGSRQPEPEPEESVSPSREEEAYMRGFAEGHAEAQRSSGKALEVQEACVRELRLNFHALDEAAMDALARDLGATVLALCEQVLGEYAVDEEALAQRCKAAARKLGAGPRDLTLTLNPETRERLNAEAFPGWILETDSTLAPGELRLSGPQGAVRDGPEDWRRTFAEALGS